MPTMPTINIPPLVRFFLYLLGALLLLIVSYGVDKSWAGDAEVRLATGLSSLLFILAAAKTTTSDTPTAIGGTVVNVTTGETSVLDGVIGTEAVDEFEDEDDMTYAESGGLPFPTDADEGALYKDDTPYEGTEPGDTGHESDRDPNRP